MAEEGPAPVDVNALMLQNKQSQGQAGNDAKGFLDRFFHLFGVSFNGSDAGGLFKETNPGASLSLNASSPINVFSAKGGFFANIADQMKLGPQGGPPIQGDASKGISAPRIEPASSGSGGGGGGGGSADYAAMTEGIKISAVTSTAAAPIEAPVTFAAKVSSSKDAKGGIGF